ncbi:glycosyltransferase family 4 protein [Corynebacterium amycolatum]|uniref:glycosyltransferase family 4 protein n=1 Tax=Corynebacterium TaxID=1716 RepID=UPI0008AA0426|nr:MULTISPECIES: glycosyltransferase family 4 protein [Corynebacterium]MCQ9127522.1 glycosyltransferase family 4 protein [Corynebacterium amycolatum]MCQ9141879.1 glycosyltransferase family 4 protein [Corynebacterium amycolatum]MCQ9169403.1 glycosyltransferase family 4 protein [Corynebacterium amycolatum]MCQ9175546.1 glycosyltransferase family 4 protein [Corynebacterium amycolatum]OHQ77046.1 glycosyltransferase WbuB [Corynebacterium sp. HMSC073H12]
MRITYIHQHFVLPGEPGGSRPYEFARRMAAAGHEVTMICGRDEAMDKTVDGIHVRRLAIPYRNEMSKRERIVSFFNFLVRASAVAARVPADVIYASSTPLTVAVPGIVAKFTQRAPLVAEIRDLWPEVPIKLGYLNNPVAIFLAKQLEKAFYAASSEVVALSPSMADGVKEVAPKKRVTVIPNASDFERFDVPAEQRAAFRKEQGWGDDVVAVYAGGFGMSYQLEWLVDLAAQLRRDGVENVRFVLLGQGSDSDALYQRAENAGLDADAMFLGRQPKEDVAKYVSAADIALSPLRDDPCLEGNSLNKVFDAMAASRPVVFNHGGWLEEAATEHDAGWRLSRDIPTAAKRFAEIISDRDEMRAAGQRNRELGEKRFARDSLYNQLIEVLNRVRKVQK